MRTRSSAGNILKSGAAIACSTMNPGADSLWLESKSKTNARPAWKSCIAAKFTSVTRAKNWCDNKPTNNNNDEVDPITRPGAYRVRNHRPLHCCLVFPLWRCSFRRYSQELKCQVQCPFTGLHHHHPTQVDGKNRFTNGGNDDGGGGNGGDSTWHPTLIEAFGLQIMVQWLFPLLKMIAADRDFTF